MDFDAIVKPINNIEIVFGGYARLVKDDPQRHYVCTAEGWCTETIKERNGRPRQLITSRLP
jgi:hypothetical protein